MSVFIGEKEKFIIDRTLINIAKKNFNQDELPEFTKNLKKVGVDFFEIDEETFNYVSPFVVPKDIIFIVDKIDQLQMCKTSGIEYILIREKDLEIIKICNLIIKYKFKIILEIDISSHTRGSMHAINNIIDINKLFYIRFKGECNWLINNYINKYCIENKYDIKTNVYASDEYFMATAVALQGLNLQVDSVTTAFCGSDGTHGTTALEELLMAIKVIMGERVNGELSTLSYMREQYEKIIYSKVPNNKSIIGINIFKYESGVHVAGIEKNPVTYEPFMPELIGMKRKLALGKHSGKNSINAKLKELNIKNKFNDLEILSILARVKNISISNKTDLSDEEFIDICRKVKR